MENEETSPAETPRINPAIAAELDNLTREAEGDTASQAEAKAEFDNSPEGRWKAAITDIAPMIGMIHPDLKPTAEEVPILADGLAPALAKHFPDMTGFTLPVELLAAYTVWIVFSPKWVVISEKRARARAEKMREVNPDAAPEST